MKFEKCARVGVVTWVILLTWGCQSAEDAVVEKDYGRPLAEGALGLQRVLDPAEMPDMRPAFAHRDGAISALDESLAYFGKPSSKQWFPYQADDRKITHEDQVATLDLLRTALEVSETADEFHGRCRLLFDVYRSVGWNGEGEVLFTAYCEPIFDGRETPDATFKYPLYKQPKDLVKAEDGTPLGRRTEGGQVVSYYSRRELESGSHLKGLELVYLRDPFEVYIAHVQGSARINLPSGRQMCVGYAGKTDRPYRSIGQHLIETGRLDRSQLSLTSLKQYFRENPAAVREVLGHNESYVFFLEREPGPFGSIGSKVTPYHTVATDKSVFPRGGPCVAVTRLPQRSQGGALRFEDAACLVFDQDTGGAIRSAGRADLFIGTGPEAEFLAGHTREEGRLFYLVAKPSATSRTLGGATASVER